MAPCSHIQKKSRFATASKKLRMTLNCRFNPLRLNADAESNLKRAIYLSSRMRRRSFTRRRSLVRVQQSPPIKRRHVKTCRLFIGLRPDGAGLAPFNHLTAEMNSAYDNSPLRSAPN